MNLIQVLGAFGAVVGIITAVVAIALYVRGSYAKARIEALRDDLEDERKAAESLRNRVTDLEKENERVKARMDGLDRENEVLRKQPIVEVNKVMAALREAQTSWGEKLDALHRMMALRFDRLEQKK